MHFGIYVGFTLIIACSLFFRIFNLKNILLIHKLKYQVFIGDTIHFNEINSST